MKKKKAIVSLLISMVVAIQLNINTTFAYADVNNGISEENNKNKNISLQETNVKDIHFNKNELNPAVEAGRRQMLKGNLKGFFTIHEIIVPKEDYGIYGVEG